MRHWFRSDMLRIRNDVVALNSRQYENAICLLPNLVCSAQFITKHLGEETAATRQRGLESPTGACSRQILPSNAEACLG